MPHVTTWERTAEKRGEKRGERKDIKGFDKSNPYNLARTSWNQKGSGLPGNPKLQIPNYKQRGVLRTDFSAFGEGEKWYLLLSPIGLFVISEIVIWNLFVNYSDSQLKGIKNS
ncbi:MAG: hypothetical protein JSV88_18510 [Candidatus Aminicenantes bacterium]|nr:MAG: hypothetical protein JSV88_18510 [Candidatus Aminicenantes bacterium]